MEFHAFGDPFAPHMLLLHGMLTPWTVWEEVIEAFKDGYRVHVAALGAHTDAPSEFISFADEVLRIAEYCRAEGIDRISVLCGMSLGGALAHELAADGGIAVDRLVLDGAPLVPFPRIAAAVMTRSYLGIIRRSKLRDKRTLENFKRQFLPEKYLDDFLKIADNMSENSVRALMKAVTAGSPKIGAVGDTRVLFIHGTKGNEVLAKKSAKRMRENSNTEILCYNGDAHIQKLIYEPQVWIEDVKQFLERNENNGKVS